MRRREDVAHRVCLLVAESQRIEIHGLRAAAQQAHDDALAINGRHGGYAQVVFDAAHSLPETPILRQAALGDVEVRHDLDA